MAKYGGQSKLNNDAFKAANCFVNACFFKWIYESEDEISGYRKKEAEVMLM